MHFLHGWKRDRTCELNFQEKGSRYVDIISVYFSGRTEMCIRDRDIDVDVLKIDMGFLRTTRSVSYTHLDVYKRQP